MVNGFLFLFFTTRSISNATATPMKRAKTSAQNPISVIKNIINATKMAIMAFVWSFPLYCSQVFLSI
jgi:hypothetical protein